MPKTISRIFAHGIINLEGKKQTTQVLMSAEALLNTVLCQLFGRNHIPGTHSWSQEITIELLNYGYKKTFACTPILHSRPLTRKLCNIQEIVLKQTIKLEIWERRHLHVIYKLFRT